MDYFREIVDGMHIFIPDEKAIKEMSDLIGVEEDKLLMSFGNGQRIKTIATAMWLLDNYENSAKKLYNDVRKAKKKKSISVPYLIFNR
jgi:hypothetical protein